MTIDMHSKEGIELRNCFLRLDKEGIIRMNIKEGAKIREEDVKETYSHIRKLCAGKKRLELIEGGDFYTFDEEAQKYAAKHGRELFIATAIVIRSPGLKVLFNFFNSFLKQPVPFKMFSSEAAALKWLREFKD